MRYWNMARQRYCCGLARCWRALGLSADRAENAARKRALFGALIEESGSHMTRRWREQDSNPRSPERETGQRSSAAPILIAERRQKDPEEVRFAADSPLEGDGFEPSVPLTEAMGSPAERRAG
jgi:hypothetical protein